MAKPEQAGVKEYEKLAWDAFLRLKPHFAGPRVNATDIEYLDPPDVLCNVNGRVGVEIVSWIDDTQIADAKRREKMRK